MLPGNYALKEAYERLCHTTPLGFYNCGRLCDGLCCRGDSKGMWLYPFEEELFKNKEGFELCETEGNYGYPMVLCSGECDRSERPLACRIFPAFPLVYDENGKTKIKVIFDPRAGMCPLVREEKTLNAKFVKEVRMAARYLLQDETIAEYMRAVSEEIIEIIELKEKLGGGIGFED